MQKSYTLISVVIVLILIFGGFLAIKNNKIKGIVTFADCEVAGYPIMESYPRQCRTPDGRNFSEDIGGELQKDNLIRISEPRPNTYVASPLMVKGMARGTWFFEASFPIKLKDSKGNTIAVGIAQAKDEWMTTEFVPFEATLTWKNSATMTDNGTLILEKDNPSGLPEHDDSLEIPVVLKRASSGGGAPSTPPIASGKCVVSGCSGQICADSEVVSTCEYKAVYACYKNTKAVCERQTSGECGWTETPALKQCLVEAE